ncbi:hypothetical protein IC608_04235 [Devosia sp. PTR5]|uniref:Uncharacterized protein n=1 Tax=Devosia oryzisoli TaxID=2774138 RepID=A0A927ISG0_9HYPH|nr:hypothetical protein [Devosia oryzisoli]MBD8064681.1 hypothetical protein [Devosia oryzisoli]
MKRLLAIALLATGAPALAQEDLRIDRDKIYVTDADACSALETEGLAAWQTHDFLSLDFNDGIRSMAVRCAFFDVKGREGSRHLLIDTICEAPGSLYPDSLAVTPVSETQIQVVSAFELALSTHEAAQTSSEVATPGATLYTRCDNLSEIPVD